jgi:hypothetical protein
MGLMDRLQFWKRDEPMDSELRPLSMPEYNQEQQYPQDSLGLPSEMNRQQMPQDQIFPQQIPQGMPMQNEFQQRPTVAFKELNSMPQQAGQQNDIRKDIELISSKLDTLRAMLDNINSRLNHIETIEEKKFKW